MARPRYRLTPEIEQQIVGLIRAGAYDWVAAEAAGIPRKTFVTWLRRGARRDRPPYRSFFLQVREARAQARARVEIDTRDKDPRYWLRHGPGREAPGRPGWTNPVKPSIARGQPAADPFQSPRWAALWSLLLNALAPFPEAHGAVVQALADFQEMPVEDTSRNILS